MCSMCSLQVQLFKKKIVSSLANRWGGGEKGASPYLISRQKQRVTQHPEKGLPHSSQFLSLV